MSPGQALLAVRHSYFEVLVMLTLLASSATLGIETHLNMQDVESVTRQLAVGDGWQAFFYWGITLPMDANGILEAPKKSFPLTAPFLLGSTYRCGTG